MKEINVLLVEDNPQDVFLVKAVFEEQEIPHKLHVVEDGRAAIEFVDCIGKTDGADCPNLLLLDINLPKAGGLEVLTHFRRHAACGQTPVIVFSSSVAAKEQAQLAELKVSRFFQKPADYDAFSELGRVVREVVEG